MLLFLLVNIDFTQISLLFLLIRVCLRCAFYLVLFLLLLSYFFTVIIINSSIITILLWPSCHRLKPIQSKSELHFISPFDPILTLLFLSLSKERLFWELVTFHPRDTKRTNAVLGPFFVHDKWYDICDTDIDGYNAYRVNRKK